jgi:hypothetical protein
MWKCDCVGSVYCSVCSSLIWRSFENLSFVDSVACGLCFLVICITTTTQADTTPTRYNFSCPSPDMEDLPSTCMACSRVSSLFPTHFLRYALTLAVEYLGLPSFLGRHPSSTPLSFLLPFLRAIVSTSCPQLSALVCSSRCYQYEKKDLHMLSCGTSLPASASIRLTVHLTSQGTPSRRTLHRSRLPYGQSGPQISRKPLVPRALYVEPRVPTWYANLADVAAVGGSWGQRFLACHWAGPL